MFDSKNTDARQEAERKAVLRKSLEAIDTLQTRLNAIERDRNEPIAIVGLSCRYPGAPNPDAYWRLLVEGRDAVTEVPDDRWDKQAYYDPNPSAPGKIHAPFGGFLEKIDSFDAGFFGISGREAESVDPQQRLLLEVAWEALENAGIATSHLRGSASGVYVGITTSDYARMAVSGNPMGLDVYSATGGALNVAAGRLSYVLGLNGPAMAVDTACSSSLVAVHLACQSLRARETDLALAGGVNILLSPEPFVCFAKWGMMAPDGRCKTFDEAADGFVRSEGCGMIVLKRLGDALAGGDHVLALIRGTAVNQDGASSGLTVPNGQAQQAVVRSALKAAKVNPEDVDYVEAHGTGTTLGDPIELEALAAVLGKRPAERPLRVGSVKTNIGHAESASGVAGLIKVILAMQHEGIPPHIHFQKLSSRISLGRAPIEIPLQAIPWRRSERARIAGVSSFGFSGTNAHAVLQEAPSEAAPGGDSPSLDRSAHLLVLSAGSETALRELAKSYAQLLKKTPELALADFCHSAAVGRAALPHRVVMTLTDVETARGSLDSFSRGTPASGTVTGRCQADPKVAFLFTGQGSQYHGMGRALYETEPAFRDAFDRCAGILQQFLDFPLKRVVGYEDGSTLLEGLLDQTRYTQPALFAFEYALAALWRSWGIEPDAVAGHSLGEFVAACVAGALSLEDALRMVAVRSRLMQALPRDGAMAAVFADEDQVREVMRPYAETVSIAAANGPTNTVISGRVDHIHAVVGRLKQGGITAKELNVSHAFHSPLMEPMLDEFERFAQQLDHRPPTMDLALNGTGKLLDDSSSLSADYWRRHVRGTVRFADSIRTLAERGITAFLEIGPAPVLIGMALGCLVDTETVFLPSLRKGAGEWEQMLSSLGALFVRGFKPDWNAFDRPYPRRRIPLPTYPFQRQRYWLPVAAKEPGHIPARAVPGLHPLLGVHVPLACRPGEHVWHGEISLATCPWVNDHRVQGVAVVPATAYIEMALYAAIEAFGPPPVVVSRIELNRVLSLQDEGVYDLQTRLAQGSGNILFEIYGRSRGANDWVEYARGTLRMGLASGHAPASRFDVAKLEECSKRLDGPEFYRLQDERGNQWGPAFRGTRQIWQGNGEAWAEIQAPAEIRSDLGRFFFHPALSDTSGHVLTATIPLDKSNGDRGGAFVGAGIEEIRFHRRMTGEKLWAHARLRPEVEAPANVLVGDVRLYDETGALVAETIGARLWYLDSAQKQEVPDDWFYVPRWITRDFVTSSLAVPPAGAVWVVFQDRQGSGESLCGELRKHGAICVVVVAGGAFRKADSGVIYLRPEEPSDYDCLMDSVAELRMPLAGVVHLWSLDASGTEKTSTDAIRTAESHGVVSVMRLVQALKRAEVGPHTRLWLVTQGSQPVAESDDSLAVLQSPLWGFGRTVAVECSELWGGQVDLDPSDEPERAAKLLLRQILDADREDQVAFRNGQRQVLRLDRMKLSHNDSARPPIRSDATYLITGGLGGIGSEMARWLVGKGARHLCLAGRRPLPPRDDWERIPPETEDGRRISLIQELEKRGVTVHVVSADMADEDAVHRLIRRCLRPNLPPVRGIFHAAGVMQYKLVTEQTPEDLREVLDAKVRGAWLLHHGFAKTDLDYFVLFSSSSALLSSLMMAGYSAANVFLDTLAHYRRARGLPAVSIDWGTWIETGMATRFQAEGEFDRRGRAGTVKGVSGLTNRRALEALERVLNAAPTQIGVMPIDWEEWRRSYGAFAKTAYLSLLVGPQEEQSETAHPGDVAVVPGLREVPAEALPEKVKVYLASTLACILKVSEQSLDHETPLAQMGFDSLMAIELKTQIESDVGLTIPMARLIQGPPLVTLSEWLLELLNSRATTPTTAAAPEPFVAYEEGEL